MVYDFATLKPTVEIGVWESGVLYWRACGCRKFSEGRPHPCEPSWPLDEPVDEAGIDCVIWPQASVVLDCRVGWRAKLRGATRERNRALCQIDPERNALLRYLWDSSNTKATHQ